MFVERQGLEFATSEHAGFTKNQTLIRIIEMFDVIQADKDVYMYGEMTINSGQLIQGQLLWQLIQGSINSGE